MSFKLSSFKYSNESSGISTLRVPTLSHTHSAAKVKKVASSLGLEWYQDLLLLAASKVELDLRDINPRVSIEIRRIPITCDAAERGEKT
jgi:hypothetical protein